MPKPEGELVYILPAQKRPAAKIYYGQIGRGLSDGPICRIEPSGEVYLYPNSTIDAVRLILEGRPYDVPFEELTNISYSYRQDQDQS